MLNARHAVSAAAAVLAALAAATPASAGIWSPLASGTTADITAVDDAAPGVLLYGTASGQLLKNGAVRSTTPGTSITDVALNPSGTVALATGTNGKLLRSGDGGQNWTGVALPNTYNHTNPCNSTLGPYPLNKPITGNLNAVAWANDTTAYVVAADIGVVLKTTNGGAAWSDASRRPDGSCRVDADDEILTDVATVPGSDVAWFVDDGFGATSVTTNGLASSAPHRTDSAVNCFNHRPRLAVDAENPNRAFVVDQCDGNLQLGSTTDGGTTWEFSLNYRNGDGHALRGLNDVALVGSAGLAVGDGGAILIAPDASDAYFQKADGALATTDWLSASKGSATHAVVGGTGGALIQTDAATTLPDLTPPAVPVPTPPAPAPQPAPRVPTVGTTPPTTPAPKTTTASVPGATIKLGVPSACVAPGQTFTVTLTWKKQKRKGNRFVKVRRADFSIDGKRVKLDKKAPFTQTLTVKAGTKPGSTVTVRARAFIKVKKGKSPTKSIKASVKVC